MAKIGILIGDKYEDVEYDDLATAFVEGGHDIAHLGVENGIVEGKNGDSMVEIDVLVNNSSVEDFDALFIPGGFSPDILRKDDGVVEFVADFVESEKPMLLICHAPQLLISADKARGRKLTAWKTVQKDLEFAGAKVVDEPVVEDGNILTSRDPDDIPAFIQASLQKLESKR